MDNESNFIFLLPVRVEFIRLVKVPLVIGHLPQVCEDNRVFRDVVAAEAGVSPCSVLKLFC
jgi:hypothetical protein